MTNSTLVICTALSSFGFRASFVLRHLDFVIAFSLRLFDQEARRRGLGAAVVLALENRGRISRDQLIAGENELRIDAVAGRFINFVAAEVTVNFVFVIVVATERETLPIGRELLVVVQFHQFRGGPPLDR